MSELNPCPCCKGKAKLGSYSDDFRLGTRFSVYCTECGIHTEDYSDKEDAIKVWNHRPSPWQTGTPTEQGWYICKLAGSDIYETHNFTGNNWNAEIFEKWQMIKEEKDTEGENFK